MNIIFIMHKYKKGYNHVLLGYIPVVLIKLGVTINISREHKIIIGFSTRKYLGA